MVGAVIDSFRDASIRPNIERIFNIWGERGVYDAEFVSELLALLSKLFYHLMHILICQTLFYHCLCYSVIIPTTSRQGGI